MDDTDLGEPAMPNAGLGDPMDDLFGEVAGGLEVALPSILLPAAVTLRIAEMQRSGCCTKLAWSHACNIAQISGDGSRINIRTMTRNQKLGRWELSEQSRYPIEAPSGSHFVHAQFSPAGVDMAAVDNTNYVHLYVLENTLGKMQPVSGDIAGDGPSSDGDNVVGIQWLTSRSRSGAGVPYIGPASKINGRWMTQVKQVEPSHVHHPDGRNALLYVTRMGKLFLLYQNEHGIWHSLSCELESYASTDDLISHAALGDYGDHLLLATHDEARRLRLFKVQVLWNPSPNPHGDLLVAPTLEIGHLNTIERVAPQHSDTARLTHLRIIPASAQLPGQHTPSPPSVLAVFTHASSLDASHTQQDGFNVIARWDVHTITPHLHECFLKLKSNGATPHQNSTIVLSRAPDSFTNKVILSVESQYANTSLAFGASDGTIEFYDRASFNKIEPYGDTTSVTSLTACGFEHVPGEHRTHLAMSPDGSILVTAMSNGPIEAKTMTNKYGWQPLDDGISDNKALIETSVVCLARQYNALSYTSAGNDEPMAILPEDIDPDIRRLFVKQVFSMTNSKSGPDVSMLDASKQQMTVLRDPFVARALSAQLALGTKRGSTERTFEGQFAYVVLNLKVAGTSLAQAMGKNPNMHRPDLAPSLVGVVRWTCDIMVWIIDSIIAVKRSISPNLPVTNAFEQFVESTSNPAIHLLLCSFSRVLLRFHAIYTQQYIKLAGAMINRSQNIVDRQQLTDILDNTIRHLPFQLKAFQDLIGEFDTSIRQAYNQASVSAERRTEIELRMITEGYVPDELKPALQALVDTQLPALSESTDLDKLYFWDTQWLNITHTAPPPGAKRYDAVRKIPLTSAMKIRVCRRCGSEMEDISNEQMKNMPGWMLHNTRTCYCLTFWWLA